MSHTGRYYPPGSVLSSTAMKLLITSNLPRQLLGVRMVGFYYCIARVFLSVISY